MSEPSPESDQQPRLLPEGRGFPGTPRWVKVAAVLVALLAVLLIVLLLLGGGHGPGRHFASEGPGRAGAAVGAAALEPAPAPSP